MYKLFYATRCMAKYGLIHAHIALANSGEMAMA
jgi:hypothetical protein